MVKHKKALKGAKGSALFMVICVMAILIVVAITAMAMVSLAYTRSLQNYTASQSYITAINTLDMIVEATDNTTVTNNYGQVEMTIDQRAAIAQPLFDVIKQCNIDVYNGGTYDNSKAGGQIEYGTVVFDTDEMSGITLLDFTDPDTGTVLGQVKYEVLPDPKHDPSDTTKGSEVKRGEFDGTSNTTPIKYGTQMRFPPDDDDNYELYSFARIKMTVRVQSGSGDTAQIRTVSRIYDALLYEKQEESPGSPPHTPTNPGGRFTQAVKTMGKYTSGTGMNVIGGLSSYGGGGSFAGLKGNTSSVYINGDFSPKDSGHDGTMDIGAGQQITINGKFTVDNNFKFNSTFTEGDTGHKPFLYCDEIDWSNSNIPSGPMDILTKNGGKYGRDQNTISGNVLSGGNLELIGDLTITGTVFVDGNVNISKSVKGTGTIYYTGTINKSEADLGGVKLVQIDEGFDIKNPAVDELTGTLTVTTPITPSTTYHVSTDKSVFGEYFIDGDPSNGVVSAETIDPSEAEKEIVFPILPDPENPVEGALTNVIEITVPEGEETTIYLPAGDYTGMEIVIKGGGNATIYQDGDVKMNGCKIWSEFVKEKLKNNETIDMKTLADDPRYSIIEWEIAEGATLDVGIDGSDGCFFNAYIYGPDAGIMQTKGGTPGRPEVTVIDEFGRTQTMKTWLMGAVVGNNITMSNGGPGIIFINPEGTGNNSGAGEPVDPGDDPHSFTKAVRYDLKQPATVPGYYTNRG